MHLRFTAGAQAGLVADLEARDGIAPGSRLVLAADPDRLHVFDPGAAGQALA
jgi:hypothetical protein